MIACKIINLYRLGVITCMAAVSTSAFILFDAPRSTPTPTTTSISPSTSTSKTLSPWKSKTTLNSRLNVAYRNTALFQIDSNNNDEPPPPSSSSSSIEDYDDLEPGTMRVAEIKSELSLRAVDHSDCFDKESLVQRLREARVAGKADPSIIDQFNKQRLEDTFLERTLELDDDVIEQATAADGSLPGGISPDILKELMANPELMTLLQNPKMQDVMKLMMTGGQDSLEQMMQDDKEVYDIVTKLNGIMNEVV